MYKSSDLLSNIILMIVLQYYSYIVRQSAEICSASGNPYPCYTSVVMYIFLIMISTLISQQMFSVL